MSRLERLSKELKRRTRLAMLFPKDASPPRRIKAVLTEYSDDEQAGKNT